MQRLNRSDFDILNNTEENTNSNIAVELGNLGSTQYHTRSRERSTIGGSLNNIQLADTDTEADEDELLLSPGKRQQR